MDLVLAAERRIRPRNALSPVSRARDPSITQDDPSNLDRPPVGGPLSMIQDYMRNSGF
ncbi:hypothetical protein [Bradyrhizobium sp. 21]|uniref:hypothetical protein n=1 Tax=Bradyrhizobium sp. 21 TaxID=2782666 RepID=UPI001FF88D58|nr:hypothetical protein [Bradyrhizobium sp. 21]MCK1387359.1 hypothetical protein [Bradyrhizobium sp. 21]